MCVLVHFQSHLNTRRYQVPSINRTKCSVSRARVPLCRIIEGRNCINSDSVTCERFPWHGVHPRAFHFLPQAWVGLTSNGGRLPWRWLTDWWRINVTNARHCVLAEWGGMKRHSSLPEPGNQGHLFKGYALKYILAAVCDKKKKKIQLAIKIPDQGIQGCKPFIWQQPDQVHFMWSSYWTYLLNRADRCQVSYCQ